MLVATALVAAFLCLSVRPLQNAVSSRQGSRLLTAAGAMLRTKSSWDDVYAQLNYDPRPAAILPVNQELAPWLRPLAGHLLTVPTDASVREVWLTTDEQVAGLCGNAAIFSNLERISIDPGVTPTATEMLLQALPTFAGVTDLQFSVPVRKNWLRSLPNIRTLSLWAEGPLTGSRLTDEQLRDVAALPDLRVLWIFRYATTDTDIQILAASKTLKQLVLKKTASTQAGQDHLSAAMPDCIIHLD